jgi:hypothetical protein
MTETGGESASSEKMKQGTTTKERRNVMNYETPELIEIGIAVEVVLGSKKRDITDENGTGLGLDAVDEDVE